MTTPSLEHRSLAWWIPPKRLASEGSPFGNGYNLVEQLQWVLHTGVMFAKKTKAFEATCRVQSCSFVNVAGTVTPGLLQL